MIVSPRKSSETGDSVLFLDVPEYGLKGFLRHFSEVRLPRILRFLGHRGVRAMECLAGFGKMAEMGFGEADGL